MSEGIVRPPDSIKQETLSVYVHESGQVVTLEQANDMEKLLKCTFFAELALKGSVAEIKTLAKHFVKAQQLAQKIEEPEIKTTKDDLLSVDSVKSNQLENLKTTDVKIVHQVYPEQINHNPIKDQTVQEVLTEDKIIVIEQKQTEVPLLLDDVSEVVPRITKNKPDQLIFQKQIKQTLEKPIEQKTEEVKVVELVRSDDMAFKTDEIREETPVAAVDFNQEIVEFEQLVEEPPISNNLEIISEEPQNIVIESDVFFEEANPTFIDYELAEKEIISEISAFYAEISLDDASKEKEQMPLAVTFKSFTEELILENHEIDNFEEIVSKIDRIFEVYESFLMAGQTGNEIEIELITSVRVLLELLGVEDPLTAITEFIKIYDFDFLIKNIKYFRILINEKYRKEFKSVSLDNTSVVASSDDNSIQSIFGWILSMTTLFSPIKV